MFRLKSSKIIVIVGCGVLIAGALACSAGGQGGSGAGDGGVTQPPAEQATSDTSGGESAADPLETIDPCSVVTQDDATSFFGAPSAAGMPGSKGSPTFCLYATDDQTEHLSVNMRYVATGAMAYDDYKMFQVGSQPVSGVGEGAFYIQNGGILYAARGPWLVHVSGNLKDGLATAEQLVPVAQSALSRLP